MNLLLVILVAAAGSNLSLEGSSNVKDWRCGGSALEARMDVAAPLAQINSIIDRIEDGDVARLDPRAASFPPPAFRLRVPVESLRCGNRQMERDMYRALRSAENPVIDFAFHELDGGITHDIDGGSYHATITGDLTLGGTARRVKIQVEAVRVARDRFRLRARLPLRMTDFRITPPTALFGMVKARDELEVRFDLYLKSHS